MAATPAPSAILRKLRPTDAARLFPLIHKSPVTDTIVWDGPESLEEYQEGLSRWMKLPGENGHHSLVIAVGKDGDEPIGCISLRPSAEDPRRADIGLWIGLPYQGQGHGTRAIAEITRYGFVNLSLEKIEACVFVGNTGSRKIFEKNGYRHERTEAQAVEKRGKLVDEWYFGMTREEFEKRNPGALRVAIS